MEGRLRQNTVIAVLGASGDLAKKKTFPALFALFCQGFLPHDVRIVGYARTKMDNAEFIQRVTLYIKDDGSANDVESFKGTLSYISGGYEDAKSFQGLEKHITELEDRNQSEERNRIFYIALPPSVLIPVSSNLKEYCNSGSRGGLNRIVIELQPFGGDLQSAQGLLKAMSQQWDEMETFRIDHYLAKEILKSLLALRFTNTMFSTIWDKHSISNVQIICKESLGTEGRGGLFDGIGIIRHPLQNRKSLRGKASILDVVPGALYFAFVNTFERLLIDLLQVLSILAMESPQTFRAEHIRDERVRVLRCISPVEKNDTLLGQYTASNGKPGYLDDDSVPSNSMCPTYAAMTLRINNPRWEGVPFILQSGKALDENKVEVRIQFKDVPQGLMGNYVPRNELVIELQPTESVSWKLNSRPAGLFSHLAPAEMGLTNENRFPYPKVYESLLFGVMCGDHSDFVRGDEIEAAWKIFTPILHWISGQDLPRPQLLKYSYGSKGPKELDGFLEKYGYMHRDESIIPLRPID